ncbi:hypothetical protein H4R34_000984 [Dimargaris verticillata]|uniref:Uncharacterized protein n=1 Tax=Dimargaris verticillata TaxID=2761393 RepID=A0A9W8B9D9_9FUNG|nr:hypothetical protein H4R34_000984 [Dimargaris verticillata]
MLKIQTLFDHIYVCAENARNDYDRGLEAQAFNRLEEIAQTITILREFKEKCDSLASMAMGGPPTAALTAKSTGKRKSDPKPDADLRKKSKGATSTASSSTSTGLMDVFKLAQMPQPNHTTAQTNQDSASGVDTNRNLNPPPKTSGPGAGSDFHYGHAGGHHSHPHHTHHVSNGVTSNHPQSQQPHPHSHPPPPYSTPLSQPPPYPALSDRMPSHLSLPNGAPGNHSHPHDNYGLQTPLNPYMKPPSHAEPPAGPPNNSVPSPREPSLAPSTPVAAGGRGGKSGSRKGPATPAQANTQAQLTPEQIQRLDEIFFSFLQGVCSNLEATDAKGEPIHQTLMAKKMQKLDETPDFRPFRFRIQAFTNAFHEELIEHGITEEVVSARKVKLYLWNQRYISRYNEEGKRTKSKGNHVWNVEAKKIPTGGWIFREFPRKIVNNPPKMAYYGVKYEWAPKVWDPQNRTPNVSFTSPWLPNWLRWNNNVLSGVPGIDAQSFEFKVIANYLGGEAMGHKLEATFYIHINHIDPNSLPVNMPEFQLPEPMP